MELHDLINENVVVRTLKGNVVVIEGIFDRSTDYDWNYYIIGTRAELSFYESFIKERKGNTLFI